ncbi:MAG: hypothetical protein KDE47_19465, partial [Caldilineaceae bacterium]|nr:hypothetical protein [Caldilineaceae bacterium]
MASQRRPPRYPEGEFYSYLSQLRKYVFKTQQNAADHFLLHRGRIARYENSLEPDDPPLGYVAGLLQLVANR